MPIRVVLAEHDPDYRGDLRALLSTNRSGDFEVVAEATSIPSARRFAHAYGPCVLLLDLDMPTGSSLDAIAVIRNESPDANIVVLVTADQSAGACSALRAGATGYVFRDYAGVALAHAVRCAADGHGYLTAAH